MKLIQLIAGIHFLAGSMATAATLKVNGSTTVNLPVAEAAEVLRRDQNMNITVDTEGGSSGGIARLGEGQVQIGMSSKHLDPSDRARYPNCQFHETKIGADAVALVVSRDVWEGGIRSLTKEQVAGLYEGKVSNWKELGGPDQRVVFFNKEPGRGTWEVFAHWLYGDSKKAPLVNHLEVGGNEEARQKTATTRGAISQLSSSWADGKTVFPLSLKVEGRDLAPTSALVADGTYPLNRPLFLLTNGPPAGDAKQLVDYVLSPEGQKLVKKHGYLPLAELLTDPVAKP